MGLGLASWCGAKHYHIIGQTGCLDSSVCIAAKISKDEK